MISACLNFQVSLIIGWTVDQIGVDDTSFNMTHVPYATGTLSVAPSVTSGILQLSGALSSDFIEASMALSAEYIGLGKFCITSQGSYTPYTLSVQGTSSILECEEDLSDFTWNGLNCDFNDPLSFTFIDTNGGLTQNYMFKPRTCFNQ